MDDRCAPPGTFCIRHRNRFSWLRYSPFLHRGSGAMKRARREPFKDTRIIPDHGLETKWGGELTWKAEYRVDYSVAGRNSAVWADSGIWGESETGIRLALPQSRPRVGCGRTPRSPKRRSQIADNPAFRGAPSVAVLPRHALRNVAENLVGRAVGQTSMFEGIDAQTITGSEQDHFIPDRNPRNTGYIH
jgi:hypothetical protein